jgi:gluconokinase
VSPVLAVDVGSSSVRAQLHGEDAAPVGDDAQLPYATNDPDEVVELTREAIERASDGGDPGAVASACFGHSLLALDSHGRPLTPTLMWRDMRSADHARALGLRFPGLHERTGCLPHSSYWPAKLAWLREEQAAIFSVAARFVTFAEYLYERLRGERAPISLSMASSTGLLSLETRAWDVELLDALHVDAAQLPRISDEPVDGWHPALFDGAASNIGTACVRSTRAALTVGTSGAVRVLHERISPAPRGRLFLYRVAGDRVLEGGALSDGGNLTRWLEETVGDAGAVADRPPAAHGLAFLPFLAGERGPWWNDRAIGGVIGLTLATTPADLRQAALEGVALLFREILDALPEVEELVATGGALLHDADWMQIMADVLERPVVESAVEEGSVRGAVVSVLERRGVTPPPAPVGRTFEPRAERADAYRAAGERLRELYAKLA